MTRTCKKCNQIKSMEDFPLNHGYYRHTCKLCKQEAWKLRYNTEENFRKRVRNSNKAGRDKTKRNEYERNRRKNNIEYRLKINLRNRISEILHNKQRDKSISLLGCTFGFFKDYLESKFLSGMSWENYGYNGWHIDHIIPCDYFDLTKPEEQLKCFHYTNLQPLWGVDNLRKSNKLLPV